MLLEKQQAVTDLDEFSNIIIYYQKAQRERRDSKRLEEETSYRSLFRRFNWQLIFSSLKGYIGKPSQVNQT